MMKPIPYFLILLSLTLVSISSYGADDKPQIYGTNIYGTLYIHRHNYDGSAYLYNDWLYGGLLLENDTQATNVRLRYDMLDDAAIFYHEKHQLLFAVDKSTLKSFYLVKPNADTINFFKYLGSHFDNHIHHNDYLQIIYAGHLRFIAKHNAVISMATDPKTPDKIIQQHFYYLEKDEQLHAISLKYRSLFKHFPNKKKEIRKLIKKNYLYKRNERNMAKLIALIDQTL